VGGFFYLKNQIQHCSISGLLWSLCSRAPSRWLRWKGYDLVRAYGLKESCRKRKGLGKEGRTPQAWAVVIQLVLAWLKGKSNTHDTWPTVAMLCSHRLTSQACSIDMNFNMKHKPMNLKDEKWLSELYEESCNQLTAGEGRKTWYCNCSSVTCHQGVPNQDSNGRQCSAISTSKKTGSPVERTSYKQFSHLYSIIKLS